MRRAAAQSPLSARRAEPIEPSDTEEVLVGEAFATANSIRPGGGLTAILNGRLQASARRRDRAVAGIRVRHKARRSDPGRRRYGSCGWAARRLAAAFDMEGAFNDIMAMLAPGAEQAAVLDAIDRLLEPYGGLIAHGRRDQPRTGSSPTRSPNRV